MLKIIGIKTNSGIYIAGDNRGSNWGEPYTGLGKYMINDRLPEPTFMRSWYKIQEEPMCVMQMQPRTQVNKRYELNCELPEGLNIPSVLDEDIATVNEGNGERRWRDEYKVYRSMYVYKYDLSDEVWENVEFEYTTVGTIDELTQRVIGIEGLEERMIQYRVVDMVETPQPMLVEKPNFLSAQDSYNIIRAYVKKHIDARIAHISSDYDFCFTVQKIVPLAEVEKYTVDLNAFKPRARTKKLETRYRRNRLVEVFNMAPKPYSSYRVLTGFRGDTFDDLQTNMRAYLEGLMDFINRPIKDCPHCNGYGVVGETYEIPEG